MWESCTLAYSEWDVGGNEVRLFLSDPSDQSEEDLVGYCAV